MTQFRRTSFGLKHRVQPDIDQAFASRLVDHLRQADGALDLGLLSLRMPRSFGLCHGVERAIRLAHETRLRYPDARLYLTDEMVHNPSVNARLAALGYRFLFGRLADGTRLADLGPADVVVLPAFGVPPTLLTALRDTGAQLVDTTCGEVMSVWKRVREYAREGFTTLIHGAPGHAETLATVGRATHDDPFFDHHLPAPAPWLVLRDRADAERVAAVVRGTLSPQVLDVEIAATPGRASAGFRSRTDLQRVGIANQTTMLASETLALQALLHRAYVDRHGPLEAEARLRRADTVCSATQDRQDALADLLAQPLDLLLVIGGYNSANTGHLLDMAQARGVRAFHIESAGALVGPQAIRHWHAAAAAEQVAADWWPAGPRRTVGVAAGASTPDARIGEVLLRLGELAGLGPSALQALCDAQPPDAAPRQAAAALPTR